MLKTISLSVERHHITNETCIVGDILIKRVPDYDKRYPRQRYY